MRELNGHTGVRQLLCHHSLRPGFLLKWDDIVSKRFLLCIISHVEQAKRHLSQTGISHIVVAALDDAIDQFVRNRLTRLIMEGEGAQEFLFDGEVLHELRGQLNKIPPYIRSAQALETGIGQHAMQRMAKLVEEGLHLAQCQQGRFLLRGFCEIHDHADMRTYILALTVNPLPLVFCHPGTTLFTLSGMEIGIEDSQERAVLVEHLVSFHVGMIDWDVLVFLKGNAIQAIGQAKDTINHLRQLEIGTQHLCIEIVFLKLELMRIEAKVPRLKFEVLALCFLSHLLNGCHLLLGRRLISGNQVVEKFIDISHITGHTMFQHIVGIGLVSQQLSQFPSEIDQTFTDLKIVFAIVVDTLRILGHVHLTAQFTLCRIGHKGRV